MASSKSKMSNSSNSYPDFVELGEHVLYHKKVLGKGSFGIVYLYESKQGVRVALKMIHAQGNQSLTRETYVLQKLSKLKCNHVINYYGEGKHNDQQYIIVEYLEYSIEDYMASYPDNTGKRGLSIAQIGQQMLKSLSELHKAGFLHQDVKPDHFRVSSKGVVKILDFGLMNEYMPNEKHKSPSRFGFQGTPYFGSTRSLDGYNLGRKDDVESLGYTLMYLVDPLNLPWYHSTTIQDIKEQKIQFINSRAGAPSSYAVIRELIISANQMQFEDEPDYNKFDSIIAKIKMPNIQSPQKYREDLKKTLLHFKNTQFQMIPPNQGQIQVFKQNLKENPGEGVKKQLLNKDPQTANPALNVRPPSGKVTSTLHNNFMQGETQQQAAQVQFSPSCPQIDAKFFEQIEQSIIFNMMKALQPLQQQIEQFNIKLVQIENRVQDNVTKVEFSMGISDLRQQLVNLNNEIKEQRLTISQQREISAQMQENQKLGSQMIEAMRKLESHGKILQDNYSNSVNDLQIKNISLPQKGAFENDKPQSIAFNNSKQSRLGTDIDCNVGEEYQEMLQIPQSVEKQTNDYKNGFMQDNTNIQMPQTITTNRVRVSAIQAKQNHSESQYSNKNQMLSSPGKDFKSSITQHQEKPSAKQPPIILSESIHTLKANEIKNQLTTKMNPFQVAKVAAAASQKHTSQPPIAGKVSGSNSDHPIDKTIGGRQIKRNW